MIPNFTTLPFKNDFMFCAVLHDNPDIAKRITEIITGRKITYITNLIPAELGKYRPFTEDCQTGCDL